MNPIKNGRITSPFEEPRPLSLPVEERTHIHGALDIAPGDDRKIYMPVKKGFVWGYMGIRLPCEDNGFKKWWPSLPVIHGNPFPWANYFYDMYGGVLVIEETDDRDQVVNTHLICHSYGNQIFNNKPFNIQDKNYIEEPAKERFPLMAWYTEKFKFNQGDHIGYVGSAGYSTGLHIHWEIHQGRTWKLHADRINPMKYLEV